MALFLSVFLCACAGSLAFNVDIPSRVVYKGNPQSMFGFTVQSHIDSDRKMILVGAPEDEPYPINGVTRPGAVYRCQPGYRGYPAEDRLLELCDVMQFDKTRGNNVDSSRRQIDQKSNQWFGATLTSTGRNGPIVACAPRYVSYVTAKLNQRDPVGSCFVAKTPDANDVNEFSPCRTSSHGQRKTGVCQAGFSAAIAKDGQRLFMGAPGSFYWQGQTFSINPSERFLFFMPKIKDDEGQLYEYTQGSKPKILSTPEANSHYDDSYMGYSITVGDFAGNGIQGVAVGVPRGAELRGLVVLYTWELQNIKNISGSQIGAYFGYCLASGDIDGDGTDDLIVGAPMFTRPKSDGYEHGRIYVIYQGKDKNALFTKNHARTGEVSRGRFGLAITSLGDINYDGFGDIAVGAPYGGEHGRGVVFIYHGSEQGIREKYSQAITAEEISPSLSTFGFSLSGGVDLDNNNYTDLAVGAYKSDSVVFLKARPVVKVMAEVRFMGESKLISMTDKRCPLSNGTRVACAQVMFCLTYNGVNVDQQINFIVTLDLDSRQKTTKRLFLLESRETNYTTHILLTQGRQECRDITVYLDEEIRDKLTPIEVKMTYDLINQPSGGHIVPPVLDQTQSIEHTDSLNIQKNCGPDNVCIPDLRMAVTTPTINYVLGSGENVHLDVKVENAGEDAFEAAYYLQIPSGVVYAKMERLDKDTADTTPIYCSIRNKAGNHTLKCDLGNPMERGQKVHFRVILEVDARVKALTFDMESNSTNPERGTQYDNTMHMTIGVVIKAELSVIGTSDPPELHYNASLYEGANIRDDTKLGPQVTHKYNIKNEGPYDVEEAEIYIMWPYQTLTGENLMYMLVEPQWAGNVKCDIARNINPENLVVQIPYANLLTKEIEAMKSSEMYSGAQISGGGGGYSREQFAQSSNQYHTSQSSGGRYNTAQTGGSSGGYYQGGRQQGGAYQGGAYQGGAYQGGRYQGSQTGHYGGGSYGGGQYGGSSSHSYNKTWSAWGDLTASEQDIIRQNMAAVGQTHSTQGYTQGSYEESRNYWEHLTEEEREIIRRNLATAVHRETSEDFTAEEQENIRKVLIASLQRNQGQGVYQGGYGNGGQIVRVKNKTIIYDENHNIISQTESSTEYGDVLGHEGEAGSSFNKYAQGRYNQGSYQQGGYSQGSHQGSYQYNQGSANQNRGSQSQGQFVHGSWGTTETVNSDVMNAGSTTFRNVPGSSITVVGDEDDELGGIGAYAAQGSNNEFKYGMADVTNAQGGSSSGGRYQGGSYSGGRSYSGEGSYSGGSGGAYSSGGSGHQSWSVSGGSRSGGGYSHSSSSSSSSHSGGHVSYGSYADGGYGTRSENTRRRRQIQVDPQLKEILERCEEKYKCEVFRCSAGPLQKGQEVWVALRSRFNATVLNAISKDRAVKLSTLAAARVSRLPLVGKPSDPTWHTAEAQTLVTPQLEALESGSIPLWVVVLAAVVGALLLLLLIFALYKCGFFKRNRPSDHAERQPLNGRDEHL
ncbi:integrin alpha pat-2 isoform X2 [Pectinophora gossypiella]|uniref:integrin alpha pat-2 isoform X2 n=1 Tax=Pectinophora gossypiella TaxID=13191 RepID=UPI00214EF59B|nr:integrin alpha pat-2 isoform X2 [Pectinophora gossypiella]